MSYKKVPTPAKVRFLNNDKAFKEYQMRRENWQKEKDERINRRFSEKRYACLMGLIKKHRIATILNNQKLGIK